MKVFIKSPSTRCSSDQNLLGSSLLPNSTADESTVPVCQVWKGLVFFLPGFRNTLQNMNFTAPVTPMRSQADQQQWGESGPPGITPMPRTSRQNLLHYPRASQGASMNIKWIWHNFLMKPSGWNQLTSSQRHAPFPRFAYKRRNALQFDILPTNDIYMPLFTDSFWLFFFIACTSTHKTPNWMLIIIYLSFLSSKCQSKFLSQKITWFSSFS